MTKASPGNGLSAKRAISGLALFWDGYGIGRPGSGIHHHAVHLAEALAKRNLKPTVILPSSAKDAGPWPFASLSLEGGYLPVKIGESKLFWPNRVGDFVESYAKSGKPCILHGLSNFNIPLARRFSGQFRTVLTVHDLIPFLATSDVSRALRWQLSFLLPRALERSDRVVCVSNWARETLIERFPFVLNRVVVIPNGFPALSLLPREARSSTAPIHVLMISRYEKYKRLDKFVDIVRESRGRLVGTLVTDAVGVKWARENAGDLLARQALTIATGLSDSALTARFHLADVYVHTSLFEGFCLPASEALARGRPVVYQAGSGIDEVVGTLGSPMAEGRSPSEWVEAIEAVSKLGDDDKFRKNLESVFASRPSWERAATTLHHLYDNLVKE